MELHRKCPIILIMRNEFLFSENESDSWFRLPSAEKPILPYFSSLLGKNTCLINVDVTITC